MGDALEMLPGKVPFSGPSPFATMNERPLNNPVPSRGAGSEDFAGITGDYLPGDRAGPEEPVCSCAGVSQDLRHKDQVGVKADRLELKNWREPKSGWPRRILNYAALALIPIVIFSLLLWVAKRA
jgi:hypothetical protein